MLSARASGDGNTPSSALEVHRGERLLQGMVGLWLLLLIACAVSLTRAAAGERSLARHEAYVHDLRALADDDSLLNGYVLQARMGLLARYDPMESVEARLDALHESLARVPDDLSTVGRREVTARVAASLEVLQQKESLVERFKTENAIVRTSARYFPVAAGEFVEAARHHPEGAPLADAVQGLASAVMRSELLSDASWRDLVAADIASLRANRATLATPIEVPVLDGLLAHAQMIHDHAAPVDSLVEAIVALPTAQRAQALEVTYLTHHDATVAREGYWRWSLFVEGLAMLLLGVAYPLVRRRVTVT